MAIKFRCPHCQQLLGISTTKAGTIVDCPACGRSVNVPIEGGVSKRMEPKQRPMDDSGFVNALQELSALGSQTTRDGGALPLSKAALRDRKSPVLRTPSTPPDSGPIPDRDTMRIVPLAKTHASPTSVRPQQDVLSESAPIETFENSVPSIIPEPLNPDDFDSNQTHDSPGPASATMPAPHDLTSALQELADVPDAAVSPALRSHQAISQSPSKRSAFLPLMFALPAFAIGLLLGTFWKSNDPHNPTESTAKSGDAVPVVTAQAPHVGERQLNGIVSWVDDSGSSIADAGAVVLLLPTENTTRLRLDARPLRDPIDSKARQAIEAALRTLGGFVSQTDSTGHWAANVPADTAFNVIVISRHRSRTDSQPVPANVLESLNTWFDSPLHIAGRLAVQQSVVPAASEGDRGSIPLQTEFARND